MWQMKYRVDGREKKLGSEPTRKSGWQRLVDGAMLRAKIWHKAETLREKNSVRRRVRSLVL